MSDSEVVTCDSDIDNPDEDQVKEVEDINDSPDTDESSSEPEVTSEEKEEQDGGTEVKKQVASPKMGSQEDMEEDSVKKSPSPEPQKKKRKTEQNGAEVDTVSKEEASKNGKATEETPKEVKSAADEKVEEKPAEPKQSPELEKYWVAVKENPSDFTGWTYLLQYVEQENTLEDAREAFDAFLAKYPYCYGYWKKYADLEKRNNLIEEATKVYEAGVKAVPLSMDLWLHYIHFMQTKLERDEDAYVQLRALFERAISAVGTDFRSDKLWETFIQWEMDNRAWSRVTALYDRLLNIPTYCYSHHFEKFSTHVNEHSPRQLLSLDEFLKMRFEIVNEEKKKEPAVTEADDDDVDAPPGESSKKAPPGDDEKPPGEDAPPGTDTSAAPDEDTETKMLRERIITLRRIVFKRNEEEVGKRWAYEEGIRRPYFHVKPLERAQLKNWKQYLDFEIEHGTHERVVVLFERCMIACALYEEFWLKYAKYMEEHNTEAVQNIYRRACKIHLPKKPSLSLAWAAFEEKLGSGEAALEILDTLEKNLPSLAMISLRKISLQRRLLNFGKAEDMYKEYIENAKESDVASFYAIKYARYASKVLGNGQRAEEVIRSALEKDKKNHKLYLQLVDTEYQKTPVDVNKMVRIFDQAIESDLELEHRVAFSQRKVEFLEDFSPNVARVLDSYEHHQKLVKQLQSTNKRKAAAVAESEGEAKKAKTSLPSTPVPPPVPATTANGATMDTSNQYNMPPAVPPVPPNPMTHMGGYDQQAAYNQYAAQWQGYQAQGYNYQNWNYYGQH